MPYRSRKQARAVAPRDTGLVADMVRQFADPYAFLRELVQNSIDADATRIEVFVARMAAGAAGSDPRGGALAAEVLMIRVQDDGAGMPRSVIEGPLLTLFSSAKDNVEGKIGKYGVGFVSVFGVAPQQVIVETWSAEGSYLLTLLPDHSFTLDAAAIRPASGTQVTLLLPLQDDDERRSYAYHIREVRRALAYWCCHAHVPIDIHEPAAPEAQRLQRITRPLDLPDCVTCEQRLGEEMYVVGVALDALRSSAGYFNRGLTLRAQALAPRPELEGLCFKVDSPALQHTLSRDDVRHDAAYTQVLNHVLDIASQRLPTRLRSALAQCVAECGEQELRGELATRYTALLRAARHASLRLARKAIEVPTGGHLATGKAATLADVCGADDWYYTVAASPLSRFVTRHKRPVVCIADEIAIATLAQSLEKPGTPVERAYVLLEPVPAEGLSQADRRLFEETLAALNAADAGVEELLLVSCHGAPPTLPAVAANANVEGPILRRCGEWSWWRRFGTVARLALLDHASAVVAARRRAAEDAIVAGQLLARYLLIAELGELSAKRNDALLECAAERVAARRARAAVDDAGMDGTLPEDPS